MSNDPEELYAPIADDEVICYCFGTTKKDVREHLSNPQNNYDSLVDKTSIGTKCTACMLDVDLVVHEAIGRHVSAKVTYKNIDEALSQSSQYPIDLADSGFFINRDDIKTIVRVANYGVMFEGEQYCAPYSYRLDVISSEGKHIATRRGNIPVGSTLHEDLSEIPNMTNDGWFIIDLMPMKQGLFGSIRPQIALLGSHWATTYHTQRHSIACAGRAVFTQASSGKFNTSINVINAKGGDAIVDFTFLDINENVLKTAQRILPGYASAMVDLDSLFPDAPSDTVLLLPVSSSQGTRKHIVNHHQGGSVSVDHFPDFK